MADDLSAFSLRPRNLLLQAIGPDALGSIESALSRVAFQAGETLSRAGERPAGLLFPEQGVVSIIDGDSSGQIEVGMIGREGVVHAHLILGGPEAAHDAVVMVEGHGLRLPADRIAPLMAAHPDVGRLLLRFVQSRFVQTARLFASSLRGSAEERVARWLMMCHDRVEGDDIALIHSSLAASLGVRRATVTDALHRLEGVGAIRNRRGLIVVRDRTVLRERAGASYGAAEMQYRDLVGPFGKGDRVPDPAPIVMRITS